MKLIHLQSVDSTNKYCELLDLDKTEEFSLIYADEQTAGRGQQDHSWASAAGENLTFSLILHPTFLPIVDQYMLNKVIALAITDYLSTIHLEDIRIKWPNDIYVGMEKICGTLILNKLRGSLFHSAICGIGLNVNQTSYPSWVPNPTSIKFLSGKQYELSSVLQDLSWHIQERYRQLRNGDFEGINEDYISRLLNYQKEADYLYQGKTIKATIEDVNSLGHLILKTSLKENLTCSMGEISLILPNKN